MRLPLSARAGSEPQDLALPEMVVVQFAVGTLLFPIVLGEGMGLLAAASAIPFLQLAGFLTATPVARVCMLGVAIIVWYGGLWAWSAALANEQNRLIGVAVLASLVIGAPMARYLVGEFSDSDQAAWSIFRIVDPLSSALIDSPGEAFGSPLFSPGILLVSGAIALRLRRKISPRQVIHKLFHRSGVRESGKLTQ